MEVILKFDDEELVIALATISNELETNNLEEVLEVLIETFEEHKDEMRKKIKIKKKRGF